MFFKLFLAFALIPVAEIYVIIKVGNMLGAMNTVVLIILTAFLGATLARIQGLQTMMKVRQNLQQGIMPAQEMMDALLIFIAGLVLLTPGFITDIAGLLLLFPPTRYHFKTYLLKKLNQWLEQGTVTYRNFP